MRPSRHLTVAGALLLTELIVAQRGPKECETLWDTARSTCGNATDTTCPPPCDQAIGIFNASCNNGLEFDISCFDDGTNATNCDGGSRRMNATEAYTALARWDKTANCKSIPRHAVCRAHMELCGCTNSKATNYNPDAIINNNMCIFGPDACDDHPCVNGGVCLNLDNMKPGTARFTCHCKPGFAAANCSRVIDSCKEQNIKCLHGGTCVQGLKNVAVCHCVKPWHGLTCDEGGVESPTDDFAKNCTIAANSLSQSLNPPDTTAGKIGVAGACYTDQINAAHTKECDAKCKQEIDHTLATCPEAARTKDINQSIQLVATAGPLGCVAAVPSLKEAVCNFRAVRSSLESTGCLSFTDAEQQPVSDWDLIHFVHGQYPLNRSIGRDSNLHAIPIVWDIDPLSGHCNTKCVQAVQRLNQQCSANDAQAGTDAGDANALLVTIGRSQVTFCDNVDVDASGDVSPADVCEYYKSSNLPGACCPDGGMTSCNFKGNDIIATCGNPGCKGAVLQGAQEGICPGIFTSTNSKQATGMRALFRSCGGDAKTIKGFTATRAGPAGQHHAAPPKRFNVPAWVLVAMGVVSLAMLVYIVVACTKRKAIGQDGASAWAGAAGPRGSTSWAVSTSDLSAPLAVEGGFSTEAPK